MNTTAITGISGARISALLADIGKTFTDLEKALTAFSPEEFNVQPFEGSWTPGQVAEHLIRSIGLLPDGHTRPPERPYDQLVKPLADIFLNFSVKFKSPPDVLPGSLPQDQEEVLAVFRRKRERLEKTARSCDLTQVCLDFEFPTIGLLTRYEWIRFFIVHTRRHIHQLGKMRGRLKVKS